MAVKPCPEGASVLNSWFSVVVFISAVVAAFLYNVRIMTFALRLEEA